MLLLNRLKKFCCSVWVIGLGLFVLIGLWLIECIGVILVVVLVMNILLVEYSVLCGRLCFFMVRFRFLVRVIIELWVMLVRMLVLDGGVSSLFFFIRNRFLFVFLLSRLLWFSVMFLLKLLWCVLVVISWLDR